MKTMNVVKKYGTRLGATAAIAGASLPALADAPNYSAITSAADWGTVAAGVITIFAALAVVLVALKGGRKLLSAIGR